MTRLMAHRGRVDPRVLLRHFVDRSRKRSVLPDGPVVVVLNGYSRHNTGDWLLFEESVRFARDRHPQATIVGVALDPDSFKGRSSADLVLGCPVRPGNVLLGCVQTLWSLVTNGRWGAPGLNILRGASAAYSVGGGFIQFRSTRELLTAGLSHGPQWLMAKRLKLDMVMLPQSIGPFNGRVERLVARLLLCTVRRINVRDAASAQRLAELSPKLGARINQVPDLVFLEARKPARSLNGRPLKIGVVVRNWWFPEEEDPQAVEQAYLAAVAGAVEELQACGHDVNMVIHSDGPTSRGDDRVATSRVVAMISREITVRDICSAVSPESAAAVYGEYDLVISVRMHAALLALRHGAAAIALGYEAKTAEIFSQLRLDHWVLPLVGLTSDTIVSRVGDPFPQQSVSETWDSMSAHLVHALEQAHR
jgi:polysaccharide pyruvyl transferase WcaK-like protein